MLPSNIGASGRLTAVTSSPSERAVAVVAVKAERMVSKEALSWALTHVVRPGDCIALLAVFSGKPSGRRLWSLPFWSGNCASDLAGDNLPEKIYEISESCAQMVLQLHNKTQVRVKVKVLLGMLPGEVAAEAKRNAASWVILDNKLKQEQKHCMEELNCSIVVMKGTQPKVLRLNLGYSATPQTPFFSATSSPGVESARFPSLRMKFATPISSPDYACTSYSRTSEDTSLSNADMLASPFLVYEQNPLYEGPNKGKHTPIHERQNVYGYPENHLYDRKPPLSGQFRHPSDPKTANFNPKESPSNNIREAVSVSRTSSAPPPLCTICQSKAPTFGKPPRCFTYEELEESTGGFSDTNLLAEGGFGVVHKGILSDGLVVAVKQLKFVGFQEDADFCREVRVLSCAQHRNVVMLIGFCTEDKRRLLVYEFICNGSLDFHLHGNKKATLDLESRLRIAIGAARGLRYLHEDCRVGSIVHRDMRPNNILLTHDFEPMVGDFGLARLHSEWNIGMDQKIVGASGYLAPEYFEGGSITEKVDVYAFGVVLMELITGQRARELQSQKGWSSLAKVFDPMAAIEQKRCVADKGQSPNRANNFPFEIQAMGHAASLCLHRDPDCRPSMSKVLRILEGGNATMPLGLDLNSVGSQSAHMQGITKRTQPEFRKCHSRKLSH
ncbi:hypothetical protein V2J09_007189 [Rumex salicifolius]